MTPRDAKDRQASQRAEYVQAILDSPAPKKLVIGGPGTGKTYTFRRVLEQRAGGNNLAMTFVNALVDEMQVDLADYAEVKTFHAYCKKILHQLRGGVELVPYLTKIIEGDAEILGRQMANFKTHFQMLDENSPEVAFYLSRADYYDVVSFDDSVYRVYQRLKTEPSVVPEFDQILVDEFQDFNPLEVAFIGELEKRGPIIIAGDDDQAVYDDRCASPDYLREKHASGDYAVFQLPFCSRCPEAIVAATQAIIESAESFGYMQGRIPKALECYLDAKEADSARYPNIVVAECSLANVMPKYLAKEISGIDSADIAESRREGAEYATALVVGQKHYLRQAEQQLRDTYPQVKYRWSAEATCGLGQAYELLLRDSRSNLGWRIVVELCCSDQVVKEALAESEDGVPMLKVVEVDCVERHLRALQTVKALAAGDTDAAAVRKELAAVLAPWSDDLSDDIDELVAHFSPVDQEVNKGQPSILLTSFKGCKGLSAGHVFVIGAHNGAIPKDPGNIEDVEISQFVVALTRARKRCHIVSNRWDFNPIGRDGKFLPPYDTSVLVSWIPSDLIEHRGYVKAGDLK